MKGIRFRSGKRNELQAKVNEIVYATDTNEWGLGVENNGVIETLWRKHESKNYPQRVFSGVGTPGQVGNNIDGEYYIDFQEGVIYRKVNGTWEKMKFPLSKTDFHDLFITIENFQDDIYRDVLLKDGTVEINLENYSELPEEVAHKDFADRKIFLNKNWDDPGKLMRLDIPVDRTDKAVFVGATVNIPFALESEVSSGQVYWNPNSGSMEIFYDFVN